MNSTLGDYGAVFSRWQTWYLLGLQDIMLRYKRSVLGPFWISISQVTMILAAALLYGTIFKIEFKEYLAYIGCGILAWNLLSMMLIDASGSVIEAQAQIKAVPTPLSLVAARVVFRNLIIFVHNLVVFAGVLIFLGASFEWVAFESLLAVPVYALCGFFAALALGPISARFRDIPLIIINSMQMLFFLTPVLWKPEQVPDRAWFVEGNPFFHLLELMRAPLLGEAATLMNWGVSLAVLAVLALASFISVALTRKYVFVWV